MAMKKIFFLLLCLLPTITTNAQVGKFEEAVDAIENERSDDALILLNELKSEPYVKNDKYKESDIYYLLSAIYIEKDDNKNGEKILNEGFSKFPGNIELTNAYCTMLIRKGNFNIALAFLDEELKKYPENTNDYLLFKGRIYLTTNSFQQAENTYDLLFKSDENNKDASMDIGYYSMKHAEEVFIDMDDTTDVTEKEQLKDKGIRYLKKSARNLRKAYNLFSDEERCETFVLVFLNDVCAQLKEFDVDITEFTEGIDTENYGCD